MYLLSIALMASFMIGTRLLLGSAIPGFHEYESFFFYASDAVVLLFIVLTLRYRRQEVAQLFHAHGGVFLVIMFVGGAAALVGANSPLLAGYALFRFVVLVALAHCIGVAARSGKMLHMFLASFALTGFLQAVLGVAQFARQGSQGLALLGEPVLDGASAAVSTIAAEGGRVLRAYGAFPHPNILGAFLVITLAILWYYYVVAEDRIRGDVFKGASAWKGMVQTRGFLRTYTGVLNQYITHRYFLLRVLLVAGAFVSTLALALTFSRAAWISALVALVVYTIWRWRGGESRGALLRLWLMQIVCCIAVVGLLSGVIAPRAQVRSKEPAVTERLSYAYLGLQIAAQEFAGVGPGNQVLYGVQSGSYREHGFMKVWHWEPVHMVYLLALIEYGWIGLLSFVSFLGMVSWRLIRMQPTAENALIGGLLAAVLVLGFFDHFLWDIQQGRLLLWLIIGLALSRLPLSWPSQK